MRFSVNRAGDHSISVVFAPSVLGGLIKHGLEMSMQGFAHGLVSLWGQVQVIVHVLVGDATVGVNKAWVHVQEGGVGKRRDGLLDELVHLGISLSEGVWRFTPGQDTLRSTRMDSDD